MRPASYTCGISFQFALPIKGGISMNKRVVALVACAVLAIAALTACSATQSSSTSGSSGAAASKSASYTETDLSLLASVEGAPSTLTVRFYDDMPSVPYIGLAKYMALVFGDEAKVEVKDGVATITATDGGVAVVDDAADTLSSDSWGTFHNYIEPMQQGKVQGLIDFGVPFMRIASLDYEKQAAPVVFDFAKYNIDIHVGDDDAYLPIATASDLMSDLGMNNLAYNGEKLALLHGYADQAMMLDPNWYASMGNGEPRTQDMADFAYNELCFAMDTLYSCSGKGAIDEDVKAKGFDATMSSKDDYTKRVQELIKSTDKIEYAMGLELLGYCVYNGHVGMVDGIFQGTVVAQNEALSKQMEQIRNDVWPLVEQLGYSQYMQQSTERQAKQAQQQRDQIWADGATYHEQGDTAVISIDSYMTYDAEGWTAYFAGTGERPDGSTTPDTVGTLLAGLERAKANPEIKNVVFDLTGNGGGSTDQLATTLGIVLGEAKLPMRDLNSGQRYTIVYDVDTLFDGSFDTAALAKQYDFNYAVLTSGSSFSCGNTFPSVLHDAGIPVIGETSAGGTDMVSRFVTPEGFGLVMTNGFAEMTDAQGNNIENGTTPDVELVKTNADGTKDYSDFYDIAKLSEIVNGFYAK